jgi:hypothetical protein
MTDGITPFVELVTVLQICSVFLHVHNARWRCGSEKLCDSWSSVKWFVIFSLR